jgi:hypothetical protein
VEISKVKMSGTGSKRGSDSKSHRQEPYYTGNNSTVTDSPRYKKMMERLEKKKPDGEVAYTRHTIDNLFNTLLAAGSVGSSKSIQSTPLPQLSSKKIPFDSWMSDYFQSNPARHAFLLGLTQHSALYMLLPLKQLVDLTNQLIASHDILPATAKGMSSY